MKATMRHRRSVRQPRNANCWSNLWELLGSQDRDGTRDGLQQVVKPVFSNTLLRGLRTYVAAPPTAHGDGGSQVGVIERAGGSTSSNVIHAVIFQLSCPLELGLSRATSLDNPSVQPQGLRECSGAGANELQPAHLGQHTHTHTTAKAHAGTRTHMHAHARTFARARPAVERPACSSRPLFRPHFPAAIFKSVLHMGNHCQAQPLCHRHAENVRTNSQGPPSVSECPVYPRQAVWKVPGQNSGSPRVSSATSSLKHSVTT